MLSTTATRVMRHAALAACALSFASLATPSLADPLATSGAGASIYTGSTFNRAATKDRSYRSRSARSCVPFVPSVLHACRAGCFRNAQASANASASFAGFGSSNVVSEARRYIGTNPTGRSALWCANFMNHGAAARGPSDVGLEHGALVCELRAAHVGPQVGAIAVMSRGKRGGHVGVVSGVDADGNPIVISGNHNRRVAEATYSKGRVYAYVMPN